MRFVTSLPRFGYATSHTTSNGEDEDDDDDEDAADDDTVQAKDSMQSSRHVIREREPKGMEEKTSNAIDSNTGSYAGDRALL